jgi:DNA-binding transcriptional LysR family regulator
LREPLRWQFTRDKVQQSITARASIFLDTTLAAREAVREGAGLSVLPDFAIGDDLATGRLIQLLPDWHLPTGGIHAVFPSARFRPVKVRAFVDVLLQQEKQRYAPLSTVSR